jgi:hypothetical protein
MTISSFQLATLLREAHDFRAAVAAEAGPPTVGIGAVERDNLMAIYETRKKIQEDAGRLHTAASIGSALESLARCRDDWIRVCGVPVGERTHVVFLDERGDSVLAVVVAPGSSRSSSEG